MICQCAYIIGRLRLHYPFLSAVADCRSIESNGMEWVTTSALGMHQAAAALDTQLQQSSIGRRDKKIVRELQAFLIPMPPCCCICCWSQAFQELKCKGFGWRRSKQRQYSRPRHRFDDPTPILTCQCVLCVYSLSLLACWLLLVVTTVPC